MENNEDSIRVILHKHLLENSDEERFYPLRFARNSPFELPSVTNLQGEYVKSSVSELYALHKYAEEPKELYFARLWAVAEAQIDMSDEEVKVLWREYCIMILRDHAVEHVLHNAIIDGPEEYEKKARKIMTSNVSKESSSDKMTEIAEKIMEVLEGRPADWPDSTSELLREVDELRGTRERTTYRYIHEYLEDSKPDNMIDWKEWAEEKLK